MKVTIKEPCHENWNKMNLTEKGRFCDSCKTEVVDFTEMSKSEIKAYFVNSKSEICVRIEDDKLYDEKKSKIRMRPIWVAAASMFVFSKVGITQGRAYISPEKTKDKTQYQISTLNEKYKSISIEFQIIDSKTKKGIPFVDIRFVDLDLHIKTDEKGNCHAKIPTISEGVDIEINSLKHTLIISTHKDLKYTFAIKEEDLLLINRTEIEKNISFDIAKEKVIVDSIIVSGIVTDKKTKKPVSNVKVYIYSDSVENEYSVFTDSAGNYEIKVPKNKGITYEIYVYRYSHDDKEFKAKRSFTHNIKLKSRIKYRTIGCPSF
jgi:hypothetical protein